MAKVAIVRPPVQVPKWSDSGPLTPPIGPAYLAAALRGKSHSVSIVDGLGESPFQMTSLYDNKVIAIGLKIEEIVELTIDRQVAGLTFVFDTEDGQAGELVTLACRHRSSLQEESGPAVRGASATVPVDPREPREGQFQRVGSIAAVPLGLQGQVQLV